MTKLHKWMKRKRLKDCDLVPQVGVSRVQISRIRRGIVGASKATALRIQGVTGIPWHEFIEPSAQPKRRAA